MQRKLCKGFKDILILTKIDCHVLISATGNGALQSLRLTIGCKGMIHQPACDEFVHYGC
jgi:hypothetical protein